MSLNAFKYVEELRNAGVPDKQAEAQVRILTEIIESNLATKRDIKELETATKRDIEKIEKSIKELEATTKKDIKELEDKIGQRMVQMEQRMIQMEQRMTIKLGSLMVISITLLVALSRFGVF